MECATEPSDSHRLIIRTRGEARSSFLLPIGMMVERVVYVSSDVPEGLLCFEAPITRAWLRMYSLDGQPETEREVRWMLRAGHEYFHRPVWHILNDTLYLFPPAPCDGRLVVDYVHQCSPVEG